MTNFCPKIKHKPAIFRPLSTLLISTAVGLFLSQLVLWPEPSFSAGFKPNVFETEFDSSLNTITSERLQELLVMPHFYRNEDEFIESDSQKFLRVGSPFWRQIGNPHRITEDLETFYNTFNRITLGEIKENYFHVHLETIRSPDFLRSYFNEKFERTTQASEPDLYPGLRSSAFQPSRTEGSFYNPPGQWTKQFLSPLNTALNNKDLNSIKNWVLSQRLSTLEKTLIAITLIHTGDFNNGIFDFITDIGLDINQAVRPADFTRMNIFFALEPTAFITSLAYEILASLHPENIQKLLNDSRFKFEIQQNPLQETPLHFFVRSSARQKVTIDPSSLSQASRIMVERFHHLMGETDLLGLNPLMVSARRLHEPFINQSFEFIHNRPPEQSETVIRAFLKRDPYGRSLADIAQENGHVSFASRLAFQITRTINRNIMNKSPNEFSPQLRGSERSSMRSMKAEEHSLLVNDPLYQESLRHFGRLPGGSNRLPYIRTAPVLFSYIESLIRISSTGLIDTDIPFLEHIKQNNVTQADQLELQRQYIVTSLMREPDFFKIFIAIQKRNLSAINALSPQIRNLLRYSFYVEGQPNDTDPNPSSKKFVLQYENHDNKTLPQGRNNILIMTHFLNEAIIHHSVPAVSYLLENHFNKQWFQEFVERQLTGGRTFLIDPLSLALLAYVSLPEENTEFKSSARHIIRLLSEYQDPSKTPNAFIALAPMGWALSLGLLDEVRFFHEEKQVPIPSSLQITFSPEREVLDIETSVVLGLNPFVRLREYVAPKLQLEEDNCLRVITQ